MLGFLRNSVREFGQTIVMVTHDPNAASYADRVVFLADGRIVEELPEPTAETVLDHLKRLDVSAVEVAEPMLRATLKSLLARKLRLMLSGLAVVLGVMFVSGSFVLTDTLGRSFDALFADAYEDIDVQVAAKPKVALDESEGEHVPPPCRRRPWTGSARSPGWPRPPGWWPPTAPG